MNRWHIYDMLKNGEIPTDDELEEIEGMGAEGIKEGLLEWLTVLKNNEYYQEKVMSYANFGDIEQNAWNDGFEDGMNEILDLIENFLGEQEKYKKTNGDTVYLIKKAVMGDLKNYIELNRPRRD